MSHTQLHTFLPTLFSCELGTACCDLDKLPSISSPQLHQSQLELQEVRLSYRQLQVKVEELTEERSLQSSAATSTSLLSEIEQSMEAEELEQEREQVLMSLFWQEKGTQGSSTLYCCLATGHSACVSSYGHSWSSGPLTEWPLKP